MIHGLRPGGYGTKCFRTWYRLVLNGVHVFQSVSEPGAGLFQMVSKTGSVIFQNTVRNLSIVTLLGTERNVYWYIKSLSHQYALTDYRS